MIEDVPVDPDTQLRCICESFPPGGPLLGGPGQPSGTYTRSIALKLT